jgi:diguanylate cyclase (GGDEF)-like protein
MMRLEMKLLYPFVTPAVSIAQKQLLEQQLFNENIQRCKLFAKIVILFESILIIMNLSSAYSAGQNLFSFNIYLMMYFILLFMSIFMLLYIRWFEKRKFCTNRGYKLYQIGLLGLVVFFLVWGAVVTLVDQKEYGHVMAFAVNFMCVSILFHASNKTILLLYIMPISVLFIGLPFFQPSNTVLMGHYINLSVFLFFCWLASRMLYNSYSSNFYHKMLLIEANKDLDIKVKENERINGKLAEMNEQLKQLTLIDELTKIPNRRGYQEYLKKTLNGAKEKRKISVMMIDIDAFKRFNDSYGHLEGDKIIQAVAQEINLCIDHSVSFAARFGGEEFIIVTFDRNQAGVYELAETIRSAVAAMGIVHEYSPVSQYVTVSIGLSTGDVINEREVEQLVEHADMALYKAKSLGRNRAELYVKQSEDSIPSINQ